MRQLQGEHFGYNVILLSDGNYTLLVFEENLEYSTSLSKCLTPLSLSHDTRVFSVETWFSHLVLPLSAKAQNQNRLKFHVDFDYGIKTMHVLW